MSKESEYRWFDAENPYIMETPYGEVSLEQWRKANEEWKEKQESQESMMDFLSGTIHFHAPLLDQPIIDELIQQKVVSVEFNINSKKEQVNAGIDEALAVAVENDWFVKLDCKNPESFAYTVYCAERLDTFMLHTFVSEFNFSNEPNPSDVDLKDVLDLQHTIGNPPLQVSCVGLTDQNLQDHTDEIIGVASANDVMVVNFNLPDNEIPPDDVLENVYEHDMLAEVYVHKIEDRILPVPVFRTANFIEDATIR